MLNVIFAISAVIVLFSVSFVAAQAAKPMEGMILGVTLPLERQDNPIVKKLTARYKKRLLWLTGGLALLSVPIFLLTRRSSITIIAFFLWIAATMFLMSALFTYFHDELVSVKRANGWFVGDSHFVMIDTEVTRLKDTFPVSAFWFLPVLLFAPLPMLAVWLVKAPLVMGLVFSIITLFTGGVFYLCYRIAKHQPTQIISDDTDVNLSYNKVRQRAMSLICVRMAWTESIGLTLLAFSIREDGIIWPLLAVVLVLLVAASLFISIAPSYRIRTEQKRLAAISKFPVYYDEGDDAWRHGLLFYANPNNSRLWTDKRVGGYGQTINYGTPKGKRVGVLSIAAVVILVVGLSAMMLWLDFGGMGMTVEKDAFKLQGAMYSTSFTQEDIQSVALLDEMPDGVRTNGAADERIALGHFNLKGYGKSMLFVYKQNLPVIVVELSDSWILVNGETPEQTQEYYHLLTGKSIAVEKEK